MGLDDDLNKKKVESDNINDVIHALKRAGARDRPCRIEINIESLNIEKYGLCIDTAIFQLSEEY